MRRASSAPMWRVCWSSAATTSLLAVQEGSPDGAIAGLDCRRLKLELRDRRTVRRALKGAERVFHRAGVTSVRAEDRERLFEVNVSGTKLMMEECLRAEIERVILHLERRRARPRGRMARPPTRDRSSPQAGSASPMSTRCTRASSRPYGWPPEDSGWCASIRACASDLVTICSAPPGWSAPFCSDACRSTSTARCRSSTCATWLPSTCWRPSGARSASATSSARATSPTTASLPTWVACRASSRP